MLISDQVTLNKITFQSIYSGNSAAATTLGTFGSFSLYEEGGTTALATANYVNGDVVFTGFSSKLFQWMALRYMC
jgi:hypothetical protein